MAKMKRDIEAEKFHEACNAVLTEKSFDTITNEQAYAIAKSILSAGKGHICQYCMYQQKYVCPWSMTQRVKKRYCMKAYYIKLLKEQGLYGQKNNPKTGVD